MSAIDPRVDAYIAKSAEFAKPILIHLRGLVHQACPDVEETIKWSAPHFTRGKAILCNMAAFKAHCAFGFWNRSQVLGGKTAERGAPAMGQFGRITSLKDLPKPAVIIGYIEKAARLSETGVSKTSKPRQRLHKQIKIPHDMAKALQENRKALETFEKFSPSHKREYIDWLTAAKREETRARRLETAIAWMTEGKLRHWKYMNC